MEPIILVDRYQLQHQISSKSGRKTYRAIDLRTEMQVMVKLLVFEAGLEWASLRLFEREVEVLKSLDHLNIPKYIDSFELDLKSRKGFGLVQTYIDVPSLEEHIQKGRVFSEADTRELALSLLETLCYLHQKNPPVVHRDIKPSNVLLGDRSGHSIGQVYLVDFGAVQTVNTNNTITVVGTYGYMPPEQFGGRSSPVSDLYSLGATVLYLVTGQQPADLMTDDLQLDFGSISNISTEFEAWIRKMIASVPSKRFASARDAIDALSENSNAIPDMSIDTLNLTEEEYLGCDITDIEHLEQSIDSLKLDRGFMRSEEDINFLPLPINFIFDPKRMELKVVENFEAFQYFEEWDLSLENFNEEQRIFLKEHEGPGKLNGVELSIVLIPMILIFALCFITMHLSQVTLPLYMYFISRFDDRRAMKFKNSFIRDVRVTSIEINEFKAIFTHFLRPNEIATVPAKQVIYIELEIDGFSSSEDSARLSIKFATKSNTFYVISNLEEHLAIQLATVSASWLDIELHDRRITFDNQKLVPISHFDRDSWKRYGTED